MNGFRIVKNAQRFFNEYPIYRGMVTYAISYPTSNLIAQTWFRPDQDHVNWKELLRFSVFGGLWMGPTLYVWIRTSSILFPLPTLTNAVKKALTEQVTYCPFAVVTFYTGMNLLQGNNLSIASRELKEKFWTTYKSGATYWAVVQTLNFAIVPEKNRVPVMAVASLIWATFLSFMKHKGEMALRAQSLKASTSA